MMYIFLQRDEEEGEKHYFYVHIPHELRLPQCMLMS